MQEESTLDGRPRLAMLSFATLIAFLGFAVYLSLDRAEPRPGLQHAFSSTTD